MSPWQPTPHSLALRATVIEKRFWSFNLSQREMWTLLEVQEREVLLATIEEMKLQQKKEQRDPSPLHSTLAQNRVCLGSAR
jgi:hypothetical protein